MVLPERISNDRILYVTDIIMDLSKKELKHILKEQREEYQRYLGILQEDFDSKVALIAEQYASIKETLNSHTETLNSHTETLNSHTETLNSHTETLNSHTETLNSHTEILNSHTETLNSHTEMIVSMKEDIEIMKVDIAFIKSGLKRKVDQEEFEALEKRVVLLEAKARS